MSTLVIGALFTGDEATLFHPINLVRQATARCQGAFGKLAHPYAVIRSLREPDKDLVVSHREPMLFVDVPAEAVKEQLGRGDPRAPSVLFAVVQPAGLLLHVSSVGGS